MNLFLGLVVFALIFGVGIMYVREHSGGDLLDAPLITGDISLFSISIYAVAIITALFFGTLFFMALFEDATFH